MSTQESIFDSVLGTVIDLAEQFAQPYADILVGSLPADNGISVCIASGSPAYFMDKCAVYDIVLTLNAKHSDQQLLSAMLGRIHTTLSRMTQYPCVGSCQIASIETQSPPSYLDREDGGQWLYGSSLKVRFYHGKDDQ